MSACVTPLAPVARDPRHDAFLAILPRVERHAALAFRHVRCRQHRADCVAETVALAWRWFVQLAAQGQDATGFPTVLAQLAARAVQAGRRLCGQERANDVLSPVAQRRRGFRVEALPASTATSYESLQGAVRGQQRQDVFEERLHANTVTPVPDQVQFRVDFADWLATRTARERQLIRLMAGNERTKDLSRQFALSPGRISQLRREFREGWQRFVGDVETAGDVAVA